MKLSRRISFVASLVLLGSILSAGNSFGQIWAQYDVQISNQFYNPIPVNPQTILPENEFRDFAGNIDVDDGMRNGVDVGFEFEYAGSMHRTVNVNVNGYITVGTQNVPVVTNNPEHLFTPNDPNFTIAAFWGDHYYRTLEPGFRPSTIHYNIVEFADTNPCSPPGSVLHVFTVEWKDLNVNDETNPNSIASFQIKLVENAMANCLATPDKRPTIEFHYGPIGNTGTVVTQGAAVGIEDVFTHMNGLFVSTLNEEADVRLNTTARTTCWPPATCLPGRVIQFVPEGSNALNQWGDGDVNLDQVLNPDPAIRANQSRFVTLLDADLILRSRALGYPTLEREEGRAAFHGDANHSGRYTDPLYPGLFFYRVTAYDAAYILMYLAGKLPVLPWPEPLPVPSYKNDEHSANAISSVYADGQNARITGNTVRVPLVMRGAVNGALAVELDVKTGAGLNFAGTRSANGTMIMGNASVGRVVLAATGVFEDNSVLGYLEFNIAERGVAQIELTNVFGNDQELSSTQTELSTTSAGIGDGVMGYSLNQNVPNPFNLSTSNATEIRFTLANSENVTLRVLDILGNEVKALVTNETMPAGPVSVKWDGRDNAGNVVANGLYFYQITTPSFTQALKMNVTR